MDPVDAKHARWRRTREGARFACPACWHGQVDAGRCENCRKFDVRPLRRRPAPVRQPAGPARIPDLLWSLERALGNAPPKTSVGKLDGTR